MDHPKLNWFGSMLITRELLAWTKSGKPDDDFDGLIAKLNRPNFLQRVMAVSSVLRQCGPSLQAAQSIQHLGWFTDVSAEGLADKLAEAVHRLKGNGIWKFRAIEFGSLDFEKANAAD